MRLLAAAALVACSLFAPAAQAQSTAAAESPAAKSALQNGAQTLAGVVRGGVVNASVITNLIHQGLQLKQSNEFERLRQALGQGPFAGLGTPLSVLALGNAATGSTAGIETAADAARSAQRAVQGQAALGALSLTPQGVIGAATGIIFAQKAVNSIAQAQSVAKANKPGVEAALAAARIVPQPDRAWEARAMLIALQEGVGASYGWKNSDTGGEGSVAVREAGKEEDFSLVAVERSNGNPNYTEADALKMVSDPYFPQLVRLPLICRNVDRSYRTAAGETRQNTQIACKDHQLGWWVFE